MKTLPVFPSLRRFGLVALSVSSTLTLTATLCAQNGSALDFERRARLLRADALSAVEPKVSVPTTALQPRSAGPSLFANTRYPWKENIVTTVFWIGERPTPRNPDAQPRQQLGRPLGLQLRRLRRSLT